MREVVFGVLAVAALVALATCIEGWVTRLIAAYDRRTGAYLGRVNNDRSLFFEDLRFRRQQAALQPRGAEDAE